MTDVLNPYNRQKEATIATNVMDLTSVYDEIPAFSILNDNNGLIHITMQEIVPGVFLGPYSSALQDCRTVLVNQGITHIVCVRQDVEAHFIKPQFNEPSFSYLTLDIADIATENIIRFFPRVKQFIDDALGRNGKVLIHGNDGNSRSATLVLAYVMEKYGLGCNEAYNLVKERRECIKPNEGFVAQLSEYEPIYRARQTLEHGESSSEHRRKRKSEHLTELVDIDLIQPPPSPATDSNDNCASDVHDISNNLKVLWSLKSV